VARGTGGTHAGDGLIHASCGAQKQESSFKRVWSKYSRGWNQQFVNRLRVITSDLVELLKTENSAGRYL
jgi:hypothetical protein